MFKQKSNDVEKKTQVLINALYYCLIAAIIFLTLKFIIPFFMPFLLGFLVAFILKPITCLISKKTSLSRKICGAAIVILAYCLITFSIWFICAKIIITIQTFANNNQGIFENQILPSIKNLSSNLNQTLNNIFPNLNLASEDIFKKIASSINEWVAEGSKSIIIKIAQIGATIPNFLISLTFAVTSSIYISADYLNISKTLSNSMPKNLKKWILTTKGYTTLTIIKYIKAYSILIILSFIALSIGFLTIKIENPIGIAALVAICDAIPIFGSNIIVLPWIIALILMQNFSLAIKISIIVLIISIARSFIEPKILGKQIGIHPVLTLISIYVGMKLFGFFGIIAAPIAAQIGFCIYKNKNSLSDKN